MGPGGSLITVLIATPYWQDASQRVSWQAAMAMAADSCDWTAAALVLWLGGGWRRQWGSGTGFASDGSKILFACIRILIFRIRPFSYFVTIQPLNQHCQSNWPIKIQPIFIKNFVSFFSSQLISFFLELFLKKTFLSLTNYTTH